MIKNLQTAAHYLTIKKFLKFEGNLIIIFGIIYILLGLPMANITQILLLLLGIFFVFINIVIRRGHNIRWTAVLSYIVIALGISNVLTSLINLIYQSGGGLDYFFIFLGLIQLSIGRQFCRRYKKMVKKEVGAYSLKQVAELEKILLQIKKSNYKNNKDIIEFTLRIDMMDVRTKALLSNEAIVISSVRDVFVSPKNDVNITELGKRLLQNIYNIRLEIEDYRFRGIIKSRYLERLSQWKKISKETNPQ